MSRQLWWTFPTQADEKTRKKAAHFYHRDIDDWAFLKFFFYITPVQAGDGSHHFVLRSHRPGWKQLTVEGFQKKRWTDAQVSAGYGDSRKQMLVANTDGVFVTDQQVRTLVRVTAPHNRRPLQLPRRARCSMRSTMQ